MFKSLIELYQVLAPAEQRRLLFLQVLVLLMSFAEVASVLSIGPFMTLVGNIDQLQGDGLLARLYTKSGASSPMQFVLWAGAASLLALTISTVVSMYTLWKLTIYGQQVGANLGNRLFAYYMNQPWLFHASGNSSQLINKIAQETQRVTHSIINALMQLNAKLVTSAFMALSLLIYNPAVAILGVVLFACAYFALYAIVRKKLTRNGQRASDTQALRFRLMNEGFGGIKDTLLLNRQSLFIKRFNNASEEMAVAVGSNIAIGQVPRYAVELVAYGAIIVLVMYLVVQHQGDVGAVLPILSIYALAGMKLLPAFQQAYSSVTQIRGALPALSNIRNDLRSSLLVKPNFDQSHEFFCDSEAPNKQIEIRAISFTYPGADRPALNNLNIIIPRNKVIGLVGPSGSGKSTAIDIILGLIVPDSGEILVDDEPITDSNIRGWQDSLGFVAQSIFLADSSIRENIAFGLAREEIDEVTVRKVASMAHLDELLLELPYGLNTVVGERGVQLSGGQRQRIGIARALYHDAQVLVLDEATSALDGITEELVMDAIHDFGGKKTIVMIAHRLTTVKKCDWIYILDKGRAVDAGTYDTLVERNAIFRRMAHHT